MKFYLEVYRENKEPVRRTFLSASPCIEDFAKAIAYLKESKTNGEVVMKDELERRILTQTNNESNNSNAPGSVRVRESPRRKD